MTTVKIDLLHETVLILTFDKKQNIGVLGMLKQAPQQVIVKGNQNQNQKEKMKQNCCMYMKSSK